MALPKIEGETNLTELQTFDPESLARKAELGTNYNFEEIVPVAQEIINYSKNLDIKIVTTFPQQNQIEIYNRSKNSLESFYAVLSFDNSGQNASLVRNRLIGRVKQEQTSYFALFIKYRSMMPINFKGISSYDIYMKKIEEIEKQATILDRKITEIFTQYGEANSKLDHFHRQSEEVDTRIKETQKNIGTKYQEYESALKSNFENLKTELKESLSLEEARLLWESKRNSHRQNYIVLGIILAVILIVTPVIAILNVDFIADKIKILSESFSNQSIPTGQEENAWVFALSNQITRLLIVGLPITAYIWATRILVRIFLSNRALMDDAYERKTMLDTYLYLVGQGNANIEDRPLILNALFRSSPGQAPDIEPPNLSDVVNLKKQAN